MHNRPGAIIIEGHVQGLSNTRSLGEIGIPVIVVDKVNCIARYSKYCTKFFICPDFITDEFAEFLIDLAIKENLNQINELIIVLKVSENVDYGTVVQVLDELNLAEAGIVDEMRVNRNNPNFERSRKFTIADFTDEDREKIAEFNPQKGGGE